MPREHAKFPNVRNWAVRNYGNRVGIWRIMEVLTRYGIRASGRNDPARHGDRGPPLCHRPAASGRALDGALEYICSHAGVWRATGWEIVQHFLAQQSK